MNPPSRAPRFALAEAAEAALRYAEAADLYLAGADDAPTIAAELVHLDGAARCFAAIGRYDQALALAERARVRAGPAADPDLVRGALETLAAVRAARREWPLAIASTTELRRLVGVRGWDSDPRWTVALAEAQLESGDTEAATSHVLALQQLLAADPPTALKARALGVVAALLTAMGASDAEPYLRASLELLVDRRWTLTRARVAGLVGRALASARQPTGAISLLEAALADFAAVGNTAEVARSGLELSGLMVATGALPQADEVLTGAIEALALLGDERGLARARARSVELALALNAPPVATERVLLAAPLIAREDGVDAGVRAVWRVLAAIQMHAPEPAARLVAAITARWAACDPSTWASAEVASLGRNMAAAGRAADGRAIIEARAAAELARDDLPAAARLWAESGYLAQQDGDEDAAAALLDRAIEAGADLPAEEVDAWRSWRAKIPTP